MLMMTPSVAKNAMRCKQHADKFRTPTQNVSLQFKASKSYKSFFSSHFPAAFSHCILPLHFSRRVFGSTVNCFGIKFELPHLPLIQMREFAFINHVCLRLPSWEYDTTRSRKTKTP